MCSAAFETGCVDFEAWLVLSLKQALLSLKHVVLSMKQAVLSLKQAGVEFEAVLC